MRWQAAALGRARSALQVVNRRLGMLHFVQTGRHVQRDRSAEGLRTEPIVVALRSDERQEVIEVRTQPVHIGRSPQTMGCGIGEPLCTGCSLAGSKPQGDF